MLFGNYNNNNLEQKTLINNNTNSLFNDHNSNNDNTKTLFQSNNINFSNDEKDFKDYILFMNFKKMKRKYEIENNLISNNLFNNQLQKEDYSKFNIDSIILNLYFEMNKPYHIIFMKSVSNKIKIKELKQQIIDNLIQIYPIFINLNPSSFFLLLKNFELIENNKLEDYNIKNGDKIYIILIDNRIIENINNQKPHNNVIFYNQLASLFQIPKLTKKGYKTNPPYYLFYRMTFDELRNVENFSIENENGKIEFKSKVNLTYLNLDDIIDINPGEIIFYNKNNLFYPSPGLGLNKKSTIHLYNIVYNQNEINNINTFNPLSLEYQIEKLKKNRIDNYEYNEEKKELIFNVDDFNFKTKITL